MKKQVITVIASCVAATLLLCACGKKADQPPELEIPQEYVPTAVQQSEEKARETIALYSALLYYSDGHGHLIPIHQKIAWQEGIAKNVLFQLCENEDTRAEYQAMGLYATLPEDAEIDLDISGGLAVVDIASKNLPKDAEAQKLMTASVVNTLLEFDTVRSVKLLFNHEYAKTFADGTALPDVYKEPIENREDENAPEQEESQATLYFCNSTGDFLVPISRTGPIHSAETAVKQLASVNADSGLKSVLPEGCKVLELRIQDGKALVNLSEPFREYSGNSRALQRAYQAISETLKPYGDYKALEVYVEGELFEWTTETMGGSLAQINTLP